jgi:hypothetical protein
MIQMVDWKVTATTIYCDAVDANVTIMVYKDRSTKCVGYSRFCESLTKDRAKILEKKGKRLGRKLCCEGGECSRVLTFRDEVFSEENAK